MDGKTDLSIGLFKPKLITTESLWPKDSVTFMKTNEEFGLFSNMHASTVSVCGTEFRTREHLFQVSKLTNRQDMVDCMAMISPMSMKLLAYTKQFVEIDRASVMLYVNILHYLQNKKKMDYVYEKAGDKWIVELSYKSAYWGAKPTHVGYAGINTLGQIQSFIGHYRNISAGWNEDAITNELINITNLKHLFN